MPSNIVTAGGLMTGVGSATLPAMALVGSTSNRVELIELSIMNTTAVACVWELFRISTAGTPGTALTPFPHDERDSTTATLRGVYTSTAPTLGANTGYQFSIPAAIGAGLVRPFTPTGLIIDKVTAAGLALMSAAGQICRCDWTWVEL